MASAPLEVQASAVRPRLDHLRRLTDDTGIIQHALGPVPDRRTGYTTDDNARALSVAVRAARAGYPGARRLARIYLAFLLQAQQPDGSFHNFFAYDRRPLPEHRSDDCQGRALRALVDAAQFWNGSGPGWTAREVLARALPAARQIRSPRGLAHAALAWAAWLEGQEGEPAAPAPEVLGETPVTRMLEEAAEALLRLYRRCAGPGWYWFEDILVYENAVLPCALLRAGRVLGRPEWMACGLEALEFLCEVTFRGGVFCPVGNRGWFPRGGRCAEFDQQPIEAAATAEACLEAWRATGQRSWRERAQAAAEWFLGRNVLGCTLVDLATGACYDGLTPEGVNRNQGAESTLAWLYTALLIQIRAPARIARAGRL